MIINRNLFAGGAIVLLSIGAFTLGRGFGRKPKADWNAERWLRLLSGTNGIARTQTDQAGQAAATPDIIDQTRHQVSAGELPAAQAAEIIGRAGYPLYR